MAFDLATIEAKSRPQGPRCTVGILLDELNDHDTKILTVAMERPAIAGTAIAEYLTEQGHPMNASPINRHRKGRCSCGT